MGDKTDTADAGSVASSVFQYSFLVYFIALTYIAYGFDFEEDKE